jgi:hypothetical protein
MEMKVKKSPLDPARIRVIPSEGFSWIDRRFVREGFIDPLPAETILLYFFLTAVSDARGLSFYADPTICRFLKLTPEEITQSRTRLINRKLILYRYPIYQVLALPRKPFSDRGGSRSDVCSIPRGGEPLSIGETFKRFSLSENSPEKRREEIYEK